jgi:hypothetical protein
LLGVTDTDARHDIARDRLLPIRNDLVRRGMDEDEANRFVNAIFDRAEVIEAAGRPASEREVILGPGRYLGDDAAPDRSVDSEMKAAAGLSIAPPLVSEGDIGAEDHDVC